MSGQPFCPLVSSSLGMNMRCETSSIHENAKPGSRAGCSAWKAAQKAESTCGWIGSSVGSGALRSKSQPEKRRK